MTDDPELSLIIPVHNEAGNIGPLLDELRAAFDGQAYEIVVVDDGSVDQTGAEVAARLAGDQRVRLVRHGRRAGKSRALVTGFRAMRGRWALTLDGDGQNVPADLARIWRDRREAEPEAIVAGVRQRRNDGAVKWVTSRFANLVRKRLLRDACRDTACGVKLMPRDFVRTLPYFDNMHRFLPALARRAGLAVIEAPIDDRPRRHGTSKYGFIDRAAVALLDLIGVYWLIRRHSDPGAVTEGAPAAQRLDRTSA